MECEGNIEKGINNGNPSHKGGADIPLFLSQLSMRVRRFCGQQVQEIHTSFKVFELGTGPAAQIIIAIILATVAGPMFSTMIGTGATSAAMAAAVPGGAATATSVGVAATSAGWANLSLTAVATSAATTATVSTVNNRGNLGAVFKDVTSTEAMRGYVVSVVTAGLTAGVYENWTGTQTEVGGALPNAGKIVAEGGLNTFGGVTRFGANQLLQNGTSTLLDNESPLVS